MHHDVELVRILVLLPVAAVAISIVGVVTLLVAGWTWLSVLHFFASLGLPRRHAGWRSIFDRWD